MNTTDRQREIERRKAEQDARDAARIRAMCEHANEKEEGKMMNDELTALEKLKKNGMKGDFAFIELCIVHVSGWEDLDGHKYNAERAAAELAALVAERDALRSEVNFYNGVVMGDGDHDKVMLARDGDVFLRCFKLLGMDVSGTDIQEIPDAIERLKSKQEPKP